jgi:uncharacterized protein YlxP (DUF503 family)
MLVVVALFELEIEYAESLKDKRMVIRSLKDRLRRRFSVSAAEVGLQDVHQRGRMAVTFIALDHAGADRTIEKLVDFVESNTDATLAGWTTEKLDFDEEASLS